MCIKALPNSVTTLIIFALTCLPSALLYAGDSTTQAVDNTADFAQTYQRAMNGDVEAQFEIFKSYRRQANIGNNLDKAKRWLLSAAEGGHAEAQYWLGYIYFFGKGVERDVETGVSWYKKSATQRFVHAQVSLGQIYNGWRYRFYPSDPLQAAVWYTRAAEQGHLQSILIVGCSHYFGIQQFIDAQEGLIWFQKAAELGDDTAMTYLKTNSEEDLSLLCHRITRL